MTPRRYWIGVAPLEHVQRAAAGGFAELAQGEGWPLERMQPGDRLVYYSSRLRHDAREKCQAFTALAEITGSEVFPFSTPEGFVFFRRTARYIPSHQAPIRPLIGKLAFILNKQHWGYPFREGHFEISPEDFHIIATAMGA